MGPLRAGGDEAGVLGEELAQGLDVAGDDGVRGGFEAGVGGIATLEGLYSAGELGPAFKAVFASHGKLCVRERWFTRMPLVPANAFDRSSVSATTVAQQLLGLLAKLLQ